MAFIGYVKVSTSEQDIALQRDALEAVGVARVFEDYGVLEAKTE